MMLFENHSHLITSCPLAMFVVNHYITLENHVVDKHLECYWRLNDTALFSVAQYNITVTTFSTRKQ